MLWGNKAFLSFNDDIRVSRHIHFLRV